MRTVSRGRGLASILPTWGQVDEKNSFPTSVLTADLGWSPLGKGLPDPGFGDRITGSVTPICHDDPSKRCVFVRRKRGKGPKCFILVPWDEGSGSWARLLSGTIWSCCFLVPVPGVGRGVLPTPSRTLASPGPLSSRNLSLWPLPDLFPSSPGHFQSTLLCLLPGVSSLPPSLSELPFIPQDVAQMSPWDTFQMPIPPSSLPHHQHTRICLLCALSELRVHGFSSCVIWGTPLKPWTSSCRADGGSCIPNLHTVYTVPPRPWSGAACCRDLALLYTPEVTLARSRRCAVFLWHQHMVTHTQPILPAYPTQISLIPASSADRLPLPHPRLPPRSAPPPSPPGHPLVLGYSHPGFHQGFATCHSLSSPVAVVFFVAKSCLILLPLHGL